MIDLLTDPSVILSFLTLAALEIVLGIDNLLFVQIVAGRVSPRQQRLARRLGLSLALLTRLALLASIAWVISALAPNPTMCRRCPKSSRGRPLAASTALVAPRRSGAVSARVPSRSKIRAGLGGMN